jgi:two-component system, OmpR family, sensor histidine kinase KdpD
MVKSETDKDVDAAAELLYLSGDGGDSLLRRVAESVREVTRGAHAYVLHRVPGGRQGVVMATSGVGGPRLSERIAAPPADPPSRIVIPLALDGTPVGSMIADGIASPLPPESQRELTLLAGMAARALQNHALVDGAERRAAREAQRQYRLLSGTIYTLKTALSHVSESLERLEAEAELSPDHEEHVMHGRRSLGTALRLLADLHELGRADAGELLPVQEPLDIAGLLHEMVMEYQLAAAPRGVTLDLVADALPTLRTDADCVRQVLDNLLSNAVRYSPPDLPVTVRALTRPGRREGDPQTWLRIDVVDRGPGVPEGEAVFDELERVYHRGGPGFRLAISRRVARLLGGNLTLQTTPHAGSTFTLWLPAD